MMLRYCRAAPSSNAGGAAGHGLRQVAAAAAGLQVSGESGAQIYPRAGEPVPAEATVTATASSRCGRGGLAPPGGRPWSR